MLPRYVTQVLARTVPSSLENRGVFWAADAVSGESILCFYYSKIKRTERKKKILVSEAVCNMASHFRKRGQNIT